ncbi:unnamed protein product [Fusarium fujikuroi]|nr:unnamed protein product [Fusarium fujikuroi]
MTKRWKLRVGITLNGAGTRRSSRGTTGAAEILPRTICMIRTRQREEKDVIHKTPSKKFKDNPGNPYIAYPVYDAKILRGIRAQRSGNFTTTKPRGLASTAFTGPETETEIPPIPKASPNDTDYPKHTTNQEVGPQTLNPSI